MATQIHSLKNLQACLTGKVAGNLKGIYGEIVTWFQNVALETPVHVKNAAKIIHVVLGERARLEKKKALGLDATKTKQQYCEKFVGARINGRMWQVAHAIPHLQEENFDTASVNMLGRIGQVALRAGGPDLKTAIADLAKNLGDMKSFNEIFQRVVQVTENTWRYMTPEEYQEHVALENQERAISALGGLPIDTLLAQAAACTFDENLTDREAANAASHLRLIIEKLEARKPQGETPKQTRKPRTGKKQDATPTLAPEVPVSIPSMAATPDQLKSLEVLTNHVAA